MDLFWFVRLSLDSAFVRTASIQGYYPCLRQGKYIEYFMDIGTFFS